MHRNAIGGLGRLRGPSGGLESLISHKSGRTLIKKRCIDPRKGCLRLQGLPPSRELYSASSLQTKAASSLSQSVPSAPTPSLAFSQSHNSHPRRSRWIPLVLIFAASAGATYLYRRLSASPDDDVINTSTFSAFTITKREQVSPTAFIITLRPSAWVDPQRVESGRVEEDDGGFLSSRIKEAWRHGLWSVEIKQPQLQIARHYTPLPPLPSLIEDETSDTSEVQADLRILIRRMDGGEMSNYLSRQHVGDTVWLRGPHLGFDISRRLGYDSSNDSDTETVEVGTQRGVVFLAGGTGIAPALQVAHKLLDSADQGRRGQNHPRVSILWANRWGADALGRERPPSIQRKSGSWFKFWERANPDANLQEKERSHGEEAVSSLALQIQDLKRRYPSHFDISYFVDNEGSFIEGRHVKDALTATVSPLSSTIDRSCTWHSPKAVEHLPDDNDATRSSSSDFPCACANAPKPGAKSIKSGPGVNLICVSGPDGFIEAYAGAKRWHDGYEMQGAIRGLVARILKDQRNKWDDWLVLKL
ncbi:hypothetical protein F4678DRAFT_17755 [Xylaria arbuscula]|nr:hypothetical protein F4678DRAFT_17755 [Xylaria arbuscula]